MLDRQQLETFASVVEHGSFERAAMALHVTRGAVSQRVKALETALSTVLLLREKPIVPTPQGQVLMRHVKSLRLLETSTLRAVKPEGLDQSPVPLSIAVNADSLAVWFPRVLARLLGQKGMAVEVVTDDEDHTCERLMRGEVIGCVSTAGKAMQGFVAERLGCMEYRCVASPRFAERHFPEGLALKGVLEAPAVLYDRKDALHDTFLGDALGFSVARYARHYIPASATQLEVIVMGGGYGLVPTPHAKGLLEAGRLVDLAPNRSADVALYWHHWQAELPIAEDVTRIVVEEAHEHLKALHSTSIQQQHHPLAARETA